MVERQVFRSSYRAAVLRPILFHHFSCLCCGLLQEYGPTLLKKLQEGFSIQNNCLQWPFLENSLLP